MRPPLKQGMSNDFQTPPEAIKPLLPYLKKYWNIWECAAGKGNLVRALTKYGFACMATDITWEYPLDVDFLKELPEIDFDCIITNPPYSLKEKFLERCYQLKKPFALLLPLTTFETKKRQEFFKRYGVEVIFFDKRINFETTSVNVSGSLFAVAWFTNWLNIGNQLNYSTLNIEQKKLIEI